MPCSGGERYHCFGGHCFPHLQVVSCSVVVGYQHFGELCCFHLQGEVNGNGEKGMHA